MGISNSTRIIPYKLTLYEELLLREKDFRGLLIKYHIPNIEEIMEMIFLSKLAERNDNEGLSYFIWNEMRRKHKIENILWRQEYDELEKIYERIIENISMDAIEDFEKNCFERSNWKLGIRRKAILDIVN